MQREKFSGNLTDLSILQAQIDDDVIFERREDLGGGGGDHFERVRKRNFLSWK